MSILLTYAFKLVINNRRRSLIPLITVLMGVASLFLFNAFNTGIMNQYRDNAVRARYGFGQINTIGYRDQILSDKSIHWIQNEKEILDFLKQLPEVDEVFPRLELSALISHKNNTFSGKGMGIEGEKEEVFFDTMNFIQGRSIGKNEDGIVIGRGLSRALNVHVGDTLTLKTQSIQNHMLSIQVKITGIFHMGLRELDDAFFQISLKNAQKIMETDKIEYISLSLKSFDFWDSFSSKVLKQFPYLETVPFSILDKIYYQNAVDWLQSQYNIISIIILVMVILGVFSTASSSILERTREIGCMRANGYSSFEVLKLLIYEGAIISIVGSLLGIIIVVILNLTILKEGILMPPSPGLTRQFFVKLELESLQGLKAFTLCVLSSVLAIFFAGLKVVLMPMSQALRHD